MKTFLVSACLLGLNCKYSGGNNHCPALLKLRDRIQMIPVCPEQLGGLSTPRPPAECQSRGAVVNREGQDVTAAFQKGAQEALALGTLFGCTGAILKSRSPSCGAGEIYDGSFSGKLIPGDGVTARLLREKGYVLYTEETLPNF